MAHGALGEFWEININRVMDYRVKRKRVVLDLGIGKRCTRNFLGGSLSGLKQTQSNSKLCGREGRSIQKRTD